MRWYLWVLLGIGVVNGALIALIALWVIYDWLRKRRKAGDDQSEVGPASREPAGSSADCGDKQTGV
ncbi:MAG: hypothetical protein WAW06_07915 [bacterium]